MRVFMVTGLVAAYLLSGCTRGLLKVDSTGPGPDEAVVVLGVKPALTKPALFEGQLTPGGVETDRIFGLSVINGMPTDGYLVAKVKANRLYVLSGAFHPNAVGFHRYYESCGHANALTVTATPGQVAYLTDITYEVVGGRLSMRHDHRLADAQVHFRSHFPFVAQTPQPLAYKMLPVTSPCRQGGPIIIPIRTR